MKKFDIKPQTKLPLRKCAEVVLSGIQFRLFRASITMAIIALAVAFLMTILGDSMIVREVARSVDELTRPRREYSFWARRLSRPMDRDGLARTLRDMEPGAPRWQEMQAWGGLSDAELAALQETARAEKVYLDFFEDLKESELRQLVGRMRGRPIFEMLLTEPETLDDMFEALPDVETPWPTSRAEFEAFLEDWQARRPMRQAIRNGHAEALRGVQARFDHVGPQELFSELDEERRQEINRLGFQLDAEHQQMLLDRARLQADVAYLNRALQNPLVRQRFAHRYGVSDVSELTPETFFSRLATRGGADWFVSVQEEAELPRHLVRAQVQPVADAWVYDRRLADLESAVAALDLGEGRFGFSNRLMWLIGVSLLVCVVGITNAMLMSVTERFKEIATMKCLGATDGFIMTNFIMESGLQGLSGGFIGGVLGLFLGIARSSLSYGTIALTSLPTLALLQVFAVSVGAGIVLSILAAIYPALAAARLAPLEAMRVE